MKSIADIFDDMIDSDIDAAPITKRSLADKAQQTEYVEDCPKCDGTGRYRGRSIHGRDCFACSGLGKLKFRTSPDARAKARAYARKAMLTKGQRAWETWAEANPAMARWITANRDSFGFAQAMYDAIQKYGALTEKQAAAVQKCIDRNNERAIEKAKPAVIAPVAENLVGEAMKRAKASGLKYPRMTFDGFVFKLAGDRSQNPGATYVIGSDETYLGKVTGQGFIKTAKCPPELVDRIVSICADPAAQAKQYGHETGVCCCCNRPLTNPESVALGIGPICAGRFGFE